MKKLIFIVMVLSIFAIAYAGNGGARSISDNGSLYGKYQSWVATCESGSRRVLHKDYDGHWHLNSSSYDMGSRYDSWSLQEVADYACKEL